MTKFSFFRMLMVHSLILVAASAGSVSRADDPFKIVRKIQLDNGMTVLFAPGPALKNMKAELTVEVGTSDETEENTGVSHLLEHYLFTSKKLEKRLTYLDLIKEKKGSGNGTTSFYETSYFASVPSKEAAWAVQLLFDMIQPRGFEDQIVGEQREPVLLEIGHPKAYDYYTEYFLNTLVYPKLLRRPGYNQTEFGYYEDSASRNWERINTLKLSAKDLEKHYGEYYHPKNYTLKIIGSYNPEEIQSLIDKTFATLSKTNGNFTAKAHVDPKLKPRLAQYWSVQPTTQSPFISLGFKYWDLKAMDENIYRMYLDYVAKELNKTLRNERTETYTVRSSVEVGSYLWGTAWISLESSMEKFWENLKLVEDRIHSDTVLGKLDEKSFEEMKDYYISYWDKLDVTLGNLNRLADSYDFNERYYGETKTPYELAKSVTLDDFKKRAPFLFAEDKRAYSLYPELPGSQFLKLIQFLLGIMTAVFLGAKMFKRKFDHKSVRWIRKLQYPPAFVLQFLVIFFSVMVAEWGWQSIQLFLDWNQIGKTSFWTSTVVPDQIEIIALSLFTIFAFCLTPRKLIMVGGDIFIKSLSFKYRTIALSEISNVELMSPWKILFSFRKLKQVGIILRFYNTAFKPFGKGLWVEQKNGKAYYFSFSNAKNVYEELEDLRKKNPSANERDLFKITTAA